MTPAATSAAIDLPAFASAPCPPATWDARRAVRRYAVATVACALFSAVYESLSHEVYSPFMVGLFAFPLVLGVVPSAAAARAGARVPARAGALLACATLTLAFASALMGVFEIYGTTSPYTVAYWAVGAALLVAALLRAPRPPA